MVHWAKLGAAGSGGQCSGVRMPKKIASAEFLRGWRGRVVEVATVDEARAPAQSSGFGRCVVDGERVCWP